MASVSFAKRPLIVLVSCLLSASPLSIHAFASHSPSSCSLSTATAWSSGVNGSLRRHLRTTGPVVSHAPSVKKTSLSSHFRNENVRETDNGSGALTTRRAALSRVAAAGALPLLAAGAPAPAFAADKPPSIVAPVEIARRLRRVPVFALVTGEGTPFHTYDKDSAGGFGYFFLSYESATFVLQDAKDAFAKAKEVAAEKRAAAAESGEVIEGDGTDDVPDSWGEAQIVALPLDYAMQLSLKKTTGIALNSKNRSFSTFYQVIPSTDDLTDALQIDNGQRFQERGRVPLFSIDGLQLPTGDGSPASPAYMRRKDLLAEWTKQNPTAPEPKIRVRELNEIFRSMLRPGGNDESLRNLVFIPDAESVRKAAECPKTYKLGNIVLTK